MKSKLYFVFTGASILAVCALLSSGCAGKKTACCTPASPAAPATTAAPAAPAPAVAAPAPESAPAPAPAPAPVTPAAAPATAPVKVALKFVRVDSEETAGENGAGKNAVDGDPTTIWHTQWQDAAPEPPHEIVIELTPPATIKGFTYLPRQDDNENGTIKDYEFYVSNDGNDFGQPVAKGAFENSKDLKTVTFAPTACRFIKLKALSEANDGAWTSAAEIGVVTE